MQSCSTAADCSGYNGDCVKGACVCHRGWTGAKCGAIAWAASGAVRAFNSSLWTWGGSPIRNPADGKIHMFASELSNDCGILHYCANSRIIHLTAESPLGPYVRQGLALAPRAPPFWDSGAVHGPTIHRIPSSGRLNPDAPVWALYYMGTANTWDVNGSHPNCTQVVDPNQGDRASRRIGLATATSLWGPWTRRDAPIFGPGDAAAGEWDYTDVSVRAPCSQPEPPLAHDALHAGLHACLPRGAALSFSCATSAIQGSSRARAEPHAHLSEQRQHGAAVQGAWQRASHGGCARAAV